MADQNKYQYESTPFAMNDAHSSGAPVAERPTLWQIFFEFLLIGAVSFGGGIVAYERILLINK